ncbi:MAG: hypothetical protein ACI8RD_002228 [Bacillariaceae sp.]|jgi:hypothetical protein
MRQRACGAPPSATKDLISTTSGDGRSTQADAKNQPFTPIHGAHGPGGVHAGTPQTPASTLTARGLYYQELAFNKRKREGLYSTSSSTNADDSKRYWGEKW